MINSVIFVKMLLVVLTSDATQSDKHDKSWKGLSELNNKLSKCSVITWSKTLHHCETATPFCHEACWKFLNSIVLILQNLQSSQPCLTLYSVCLESFYSNSLIMTDTVATSSFWCNGFNVWNKTMCFPTHRSCSTSANTNTLFPNKAFLAYVKRLKLGLSNHQSVCLCPPLITFKPLGRFSWNLVWR
jgi:hypothetical protein